MALLVVLRGAFLRVTGTLLFNEFLVPFEDEGFILVILILQAIQKSSLSIIFSFIINFFENIEG